MTAGERITVVMVTRNRRDEARETAARLLSLPERPAVIVVDNASEDATAEAVAGLGPRLRVVRLPTNLGAAGRNCGVALARTPYVAFSDDDSWWAPGSLATGAALFDSHPRLAVAAARILVGPDAVPDPACSVMESSPLDNPGPPGRAVLGFVACGAVLRRRAFLEVGGFRSGLGIGGEEELLCLDLAAGGWLVRYCPELIAHHQPSAKRAPASDRRRRQAANALRTTWMRRRPVGALRRSGRLALGFVADPPSRRGMLDALGDLPRIWQERRPLPPAVERQAARL